MPRVVFLKIDEVQQGETLLHRVGRGFQNLQFLIEDVGQFHQMTLQARFQRLGAMDRNGDTKRCSGADKNMVAAVDTLELPAFSLKEAAEILAA